MAPRLSKTQLGFLAAANLVPLVAYSQVYLTEAQVLDAVFPGERLTRKTIELRPDEVKRIEELSGETVRNTQLTVWTGASKNAVIIDQALGKHEFITFAVGFTKNKAIKDVEIMEYRETYGYQVKNEEWRKQFLGKESSAPLKVGKDIVNISGATLSSTHVTAGVRRLLRTYEVIQNRL